MHTCKQHSTDITDPTSEKISGAQTPEYQKIQENFDTIISHLVAHAILSAEELADKLFLNKLITSGTQEDASLSTVAKTNKIRALIVAVLARSNLIQLNARSLCQFLVLYVEQNIW